MFDFGLGADAAPEPNQEASRKKKREGECQVCERPKLAKHIRCEVHKRAYDVIRKQSQNDREEKASFDKIFGKAGDPEKQVQVLLDFDSKNLDAEPGKRKKRVDLLSYNNATGSRASVDDESGNYKWDQELFLHQMENLRGWSPSQSAAMWDKLKLVEKNVADYKGGADGKSLRLRIPSYLVGEDRDWVKRGRYEDRNVSSSMRLKEAEVVQATKELGRGHSSNLLASALSSDAFVANFEAPLPSGGLATQGVAYQHLTVQGILADANAGNPPQHALVAGGSPVKNTAGKESVAEASPAKVAEIVNSDSQLPSKQQVVDISSQRNNADSDLGREFQRLESELMGFINDALGACKAADAGGEAFVRTVKERREVACGILGKVCTPTPEKNQITCAEITDFAAKLREQTVEDETERKELQKNIETIPGETNSHGKARMHQALLKFTLRRVALLPVERPMDIQATSMVKELFGGLREATIADQLEKSKSSLESAREALKQFCACLKQATKDLKINTAKQKKEADAKAKADARKKEQREQQARSEHIKAAKAKAAPEGFTICSLDVAKHAQIARCDNVKDDYDGLSPLIIHSCPDVRSLSIADGEAPTIAKSLTAFSAEYATKCKGSDKRTQAPLLPQHGLSEVEPTLAKLLPKNIVDVEELRSPWLFGYAKGMACNLPEPAGCGTLRLCMGGRVSIGCVAAKNLVDYLKGAKWFFDPAAPTWYELRSWFQGASQQALDDSISKGVQWYFGAMQAHEALLMPPGFLLSSGCTSSSWGIRKSFLLKNSACTQSINALSLLHEGFPDLAADAELYRKMSTASQPPVA